MGKECLEQRSVYEGIISSKHSFSRSACLKLNYKWTIVVLKKKLFEGTGVVEIRREAKEQGGSSMAQGLLSLWPSYMAKPARSIQVGGRANKKGPRCWRETSYIISITFF